MESIKIIDLEKLVSKKGRMPAGRFMAMYLSNNNGGRITTSIEILRELKDSDCFRMQFAVNQLTGEKYFVFSKDSGIQFNYTKGGKAVIAYGNKVVSELARYFKANHDGNVSLKLELSENTSKLHSQLTYKIKESE